MTDQQKKSKKPENQKHEKKASPEKRGPKPERLVIEGDWTEAIKKSFEKTPPELNKTNPTTNE